MRTTTLNVNGTEFDIDADCDICEENLLAIRIGAFDYSEIIVITPDFNGHGKRTHWHVQLIDRSDPNVANMTIKEL